MLNCQYAETHDCLDNDHFDRSVFLQNLIKAGLRSGMYDKAAKALNELRIAFHERAKIFETLVPYFPIGNSLSEEMAQYRLQQIIELADSIDNTGSGSN